jgi:hypothetical protein
VICQVLLFRERSKTLSELLGVLLRRCFGRTTPSPTPPTFFFSHFFFFSLQSPPSKPNFASKFQLPALKSTASPTRPSAKRTQGVWGHAPSRNIAQYKKVGVNPNPARESWGKVSYMGNLDKSGYLPDMHGEGKCAKFI